MTSRHLRLVSSNDSTASGQDLTDVSQGLQFDKLPATGVQPGRDSLTVDDLYPAAEELGSSLQVVLRLLVEVADYLSEAVMGFQQDRLLEADNALIHSGRALRELFAHRDLGDGFATVINACLQALRNRGGTMPAAQLTNIRSVVLKLRSLPNINYDTATELVMQLEDAGLNVDPPGFDVLVELLAN